MTDYMSSARDEMLEDSWPTPTEVDVSCGRHLCMNTPASGSGAENSTAINFASPRGRSESSEERRRIRSYQRFSRIIHSFQCLHTVT